MKNYSSEKSVVSRRNTKNALIASFLTLFMLISGLANLSASSNAILQKRVTLNLSNVTIKEALNELKKSSEFLFWYSNSDVNDQERVSVNATNMPVEAVLDQILQKQQLQYEVKDKLITIFKPKSSNLVTPKKEMTVSGRVVDGSNDDPLPGVSVFVKGTSKSTLTDIDGKYSIATNEGAVIQFSYIGMKPKTVLVGKSPILDVSMSQDSKQLSEVVVTALGVKREQKALGYSVQGVKGEKLLQVKGLDMATSLTGKVAGLSVYNSSEFGEQATITLRGQIPLLVIDGVPFANMTLRDIPADDIDNISVLKGATASALYGETGKNGVLMVTTKRGEAKNGVSVTFNSSTLLGAGHLAIPELQSTFGRVVNQDPSTLEYSYVRSGDGSWGPPMSGQPVIQWDPISKSMKSMPYLPIGKDNFKNFLEPSFVLNNNVSITQQGKYGSFRSSATWAKNKGQYPNSMFDKIAYTVAGDMKVDKFSLNSSMTYNKQTSPNTGFNGYTGYDPMYNLLVWSSADYDILQMKDYWLVKDELQNNSYTDTNNNPYFDRNERTHSLDRDILNGNLTLNYDLQTGLKLTLRSGFDTYSDRQTIKISKGSFKSAGVSTILKNGSQVWGESDLGQFDFGLGRGYSLTNDLFLSFNKKLENYSFDGMIGGSMKYVQDEGIESFTQGGLLIPGYYSLKSSVNPKAVNSRISRFQENGAYGRFTAAWKSIIFLDGTFRNTWSSTLDANSRSYFYPSIAGSFVISELMPKYDWLSFWKVRGSWTNTKQSPGIYAVKTAFGISNNAWGNLTGASLPTSIRGSEYFPQSESTIEVGTAANFWNNRLSVDLAYFKVREYNNLSYAGMSSASGYYSKFVNTQDEKERRGLEVTINATPIKEKDWQLDVQFNWSSYARYITKKDPVFSSNLPWNNIGDRADAYVIRDFQREPSTGKIIYVNGVPKYSDYDSKFGNYDPDWIWGANSTLRYKNLSLYLALDGRVGGIAQTTTEMYMWRAGSHPNSVTPERMLDATIPGSKNYVGDGVKVVSGAATYDTYGNILTDDRVFASNDAAVTYQEFQNNYHKNSAWGGPPSPVDAYSTTFLKIREVALTYSLPSKLYSKIGAKNLSIAAVAQNVFLWAKKFKYSDPDGGYENFSDPSIRYVGFNLKVGF